MPPAAPAPGEVVVMGRILGPFGFRGWIKVRPLSEVPDALLGHGTWWVRAAGNSTWRKVEQNAARMHAATLVAKGGMQKMLRGMKGMLPGMR